MPTITILGTGTGIGKTFVSCALARALAKARPDTTIIAIKPIESGASDTPRPDSDAALLARASHPPIDALPQPYAFAEPLSPHLAARKTGVRIELPNVLSWIERVQQMATQATCCSAQPSTVVSRTVAASIVTTHSITSVQPDERKLPADPPESSDWPESSLVTILETAGAVFSPLSPSLTNFDLARAIPESLWLLVAPDRLGVLHDLTATLFMMKQLGRVPDLIVLSQPDPKDPSLNTNASELSQLGIAAVCATVSHLGEVPPQLLDALIQGTGARIHGTKRP